MDGLIFLAFIVILYFVIYKPVGNAHGTVNVGGEQYRYKWGSVGGRKGVEVRLPYALPQIYLDSHQDSKVLGPTRLFDPSQRMDLEGNFDKNFRVYVPKGYESLALSILSPDVMQTILDAASRYDVEISGTSLRVTTSNWNFRSDKARAEVLGIAEKILVEIDHRLKSWSAEDALKAQNIHLKSKNEETFKVGRRLLSMKLMANILIVLAFAIPLSIGLKLIIFPKHGAYGDPAEGVVLIGFTIMIGVGLIISFRNNSKS